MNRQSLTTALSFAGLAAACLLGATGCAHTHASGATAPKRVAKAALKAVLRPVLTSAQLVSLKPNEAGKIPILMYHAIGAKTCFRGHRYDRDGLNIAPETFRKQLALMYGAHWYPVNMRDVLTAHLDVPAGKTPVVITFDDARGTQFHYLKDGSIDPDCAVGILLAFHQQHPDWPLRASFYVLPQSAWNPVPFWQRGQERKKLQWLVAQGFEVANHSTTHRLMTHMTAQTLEWEMAECAKYVEVRAPGATMDTMALPGGAAPRKALWPCLMQGQFHNIHYRERCILMAWGGPADSWVSRRFDAERVKRIGVQPGYMESWMARMRPGGRVPAFVSDGNPDTVTVPRSQAPFVNPNRLQGARLVIYGDGGKPVLKPSVVASARTPSTAH